MKILMAEDDDVSAMALKMMLEAKGHDVTVAPDGEVAWGILKTEYFPIVIVDWMMPHMDGLELCRRIRDRECSAYMCVIMLTARQEWEDCMEALRAGADVFLTKPLVPSDLHMRIQIAERLVQLEEEAMQKRAEENRRIFTGSPT